MTKQTDILIIGGGIAGLSLAILLGGIGINVCLVEPYPPAPLKKTRPDARTIALMQSSLNVIRAAGVWEAVAPFAAALKTMRIIDDNAPGRGKIDAAFDSCEIGLEQYGFNIPNSILRAALYEAASKSKTITLHHEAFKGYEVDSAHITASFDKGPEIKARLIIGADGRNSPVRTQAGIECHKHEYNQTAITCLINHSQSHNGAATEFHRPSGPLAFVPMPGNQSSVVWVETPERAADILHLKKEDFIQTLQDLSQNILGGITLEHGPQSWPLCTIKAQSLTAPRMALMAEAAHVMSPITAQGLNLSLRDVAALAETITDAMRLGLDPGAQAILSQYAKRRRIDVGTRVFGVDRMNRIVSTDMSIVTDLRRAGLKTVEKIPPLKRLAMRQGLAPEIDAGRLTRGHAL